MRMRVEGRSSFSEQAGRKNDADQKSNSGEKVLDWKSLCEAGGVSKPSKLQTASFKDSGIRQINPEKFEEFTSLRSIDLTSNFVPLETLASLPSLHTITLQRNRIVTLNPPALKFSSLQELDVSYNKLKASAMLALASLPALRKLNIDYNYLGKIPEEIGEFGAFPSLQKLSAAGNGLHSSSLIPLSKIRRLVYLSLSKNSISSVPEEVFSYPKPFQRLTELDLSFNCLKEPSTLVALRFLHHLHKVILWGNPVAKNVGKPVIKAFLQARRSGQSWPLEVPPAHRHPYQRFSYASRPQSCLLNDAELLQTAESKAETKEKKQEVPPPPLDESTSLPADRSAFGASMAFLSLKRELAFPPAPAELKPPHYWAPPKRPDSSLLNATKEQHPSLLDRVRKLQVEKQKQKADVILKVMHERLKDVETGLSHLKSKLTPICKF